jgi:hypothetical protein
MKENSTATDNVVQSVLAKIGILGAKELKAWKHPQDDIRRLSERDYSASLRHQLTYAQITELAGKATDVWPKFNQKVLGPPSRRFFSRAADALHLRVKAARYTSLALYGFYVDGSRTAMSKPLIFINSAHHALAIGTAFCHEVGHHFCTGISSTRKSSGVRFYFDAAYAEHLEDQGELAADVIVSLGGYPKAAAKTIFTRERRKRIARTGAIGQTEIGRIRSHLEASYGFDFSTALSPDQNLQYLAGMIHYAKLRAALLEEYDI